MYKRGFKIKREEEAREKRGEEEEAIEHFVLGQRVSEALVSQIIESNSSPDLDAL